MPHSREITKIKVLPLDKGGKTLGNAPSDLKKAVAAFTSTSGPPELHTLRLTLEKKSGKKRHIEITCRQNKLYFRICA